MLDVSVDLKEARPIQTADEVTELARSIEHAVAVEVVESKPKPQVTGRILLVAMENAGVA
jgi:hypothetical protein